MPALLLHSASEPAALPLWLVSESALESWLAAQPPRIAQWASDGSFKAERHRVLLLPDANGKVCGAALGLGRLVELRDLSLWHVAGLTDRLPPADFQCVTELPAAAADQFALGFLYGQYRFERYRRPPAASRATRLIAPANCDIAHVECTYRSLSWARDLINTPASDLGPHELAAEVVNLAKQFSARHRVVEGAHLLEQNFPMIHAVGRASSRSPCLADLSWGSRGPRITLVGKGVCFDSGGLDLKNAPGMQLMKKDMGGAACVLALARMIMESQLPVRLRVLIPAVENSVGGDAYRPGDVLATRKGLSVEIGNTDAEGRLVLADAIAEADSESPDLLIDVATLTGAARVALGPDLPALYGNDESLCAQLLRHGQEQHDPLWPMPLWSPYEEDLASKVADLGNASASTFAGSIIGALFLKRFVSERTPWLHLDLYAWNPKERPGRPVGAEAQSVRALFALIKERSTAPS
jgi:leucyl aminopeptidase